MQINHSTWNLRHIPLFDEEIIGNEIPLSGISISGFQKKYFYTESTRQKLIFYMNSCIPIISSTLRRQNAYSKEPISALTLYTDGQVIFNNLLLEYIIQDNFIIPDKWYKIISDNDFILGSILLDEDKISEKNIDIFNTVEETFDQSPTIAKAIRI